MNNERPYVFIGSSSEGMDVALALQAQLSKGREFEPEVWDQGSLPVGGMLLQRLLEKIAVVDFAVMVLTGDDFFKSRGNEGVAPRDNVIFELGLFMSSLGMERTLVLRDRASAPKIPVDLGGLLVADYEPPRVGSWEAAVAPGARKLSEAMRRAGARRRIGFRESLDDVKRTVITAGQTGPLEQAYFDKLAQVLEMADPSSVSLVYADIDGLRSMTRGLFLKEREQRQVQGRTLGRRLESEIRADFVDALRISLTDAVYQLHPNGLKHDSFGLPDPDVVLIARKLPYDGALKLAECLQATFKDEARRLWSSDVNGAPSVSLAVCSAARLPVAWGSAEIHRALRSRFKQLKDSSEPGRIFRHEDLGEAFLSR